MYFNRSGNAGDGWVWSDAKNSENDIGERCDRDRDFGKFLPSEQQGGLEAGCDDFISKPIRSEELLECLKRHLNLEWIYDGAEVYKVDSGEQNYDEKLAKLELIAPPNAEIAIFFDLAMSGDLGGIQEEANKLKRLSPKYLAFANHISELASNFEEEKILEFVQQYRGK